MRQGSWQAEVPDKNITGMLVKLLMSRRSWWGSPPNMRLWHILGRYRNIFLKLMWNSAHSRHCYFTFTCRIQFIVAFPTYRWVHWNVVGRNYNYIRKKKKKPTLWSTSEECSWKLLPEVQKRPPNVPNLIHINLKLGRKKNRKNKPKGNMKLFTASNFGKWTLNFVHELSCCIFSANESMP